MTTAETVAEARLSGKEYVAEELRYLFEDQKRSVALVNDMERNTLILSAAIYSFLLTRHGLATFPFVAIAFLPFLVTLLSCTRFLGIRERMRRVDERIRHIQRDAGVAGWWDDDFSRIEPGQAADGQAGSGWTTSACPICDLLRRAWRAQWPWATQPRPQALIASRDLYWALSIIGTLVLAILAILFRPSGPNPA